MNDTKFKPSSDVIDSLATEPLNEIEEFRSRIDGYTPVNPIAPQIINVETVENRRLAQDHIRFTLGVVRNALVEMAELAPLSQKAGFYQQVAFLAKTIIEGSQVLAELEPENSDKEKPRPTSQHLHVTLTSAQLNDIITKQLKKE